MEELGSLKKSLTSSSVKQFPFLIGSQISNLSIYNSPEAIEDVS
jgi:hypothetical protein